MSKEKLVVRVTKANNKYKEPVFFCVCHREQCYQRIDKGDPQYLAMLNAFKNPKVDYFYANADKFGKFTFDYKTRLVSIHYRQLRSRYLTQLRGGDNGRRKVQ
jgi:hypothetical protein